MSNAPLTGKHDGKQCHCMVRARTLTDLRIFSGELVLRYSSLILQSMMGTLLSFLFGHTRFKLVIFFEIVEFCFGRGLCT